MSPPLRSRAVPGEPSSNIGGDRFTDEPYWDDYWEHTNLPREMRHDPHTLQINAILDVFDAHLAPDPQRTALEVGGAPGQYLAYLHRRHGYGCAVLDFSGRGSELARRNFELLGIPVEVHHRDLLEPGLDIGRFDVAYSLGLIEHFTDLTGVVGAHARLVKPGGTLIVGAPNIVGVNQWFMKRLGPDRLAVHNPDCLRIERWDAFERELQLHRRFRGYIGGFEPGVFAVLERKTVTSLPLWALTLAMVKTVGRRFPRLRRFNPPWLSGYLIGVYTVGGGS
jgi:SAM-dependent methyltransferase